MTRGTLRSVRDDQMNRVYVTQENNLDFSKAEQFGELVFLSDRRDDFHNITNSEHNTRLIGHLKFKLQDFREEHDYLVLTGSPYVNAVIFTILGWMKISTLRLLRWDNRDLLYIPLTLNLGDD